MRLSSIQSFGKDLAETAVMAHWIAPSYATPRAEGLTILENLCPPRAEWLACWWALCGSSHLV